jgi:hypothetical protein
MATKQKTLTGEVADEDSRRRPRTMLWCADCDGFILRSRRHDHAHDLVEIETLEDDDEEDEPERVGSIYEITLSYTVDYRFHIAAWSEHEAKDRAEDLALDARPADKYLVHSKDRELKTIMSDHEKVRDDFDVYDGEPLWEVFSDGDD